MERDSKKIIRRLEAEGWIKTRQRGSHTTFKKAGVDLIITVPHPKKDIAIGTARNIARCAGWLDET